MPRRPTPASLLLLFLVAASGEITNQRLRAGGPEAISRQSVSNENQSSSTPDVSWEAHFERGRQSHGRADYAAAVVHYRAAMEAAKAFGEHDSRFGKCATNLAWALYHLGRYSEAEPLAKRNLTIQEKAVGEWHPDFAEALDAIAVIHLARGDYRQAEVLRKRSIVIFEKTRGKNDPDLAASLNSLAALYRSLGRYPEAEPVVRRAISIWES
jgi:tetratricopeptide (TPR) repeat protein